MSDLQMTILSNPEDTWDAYCAETPEDGRSPQGAMAFALDRLYEVLPEIEKLRNQLVKVNHALAFYADPDRYDGPNLNPLPNDPYAPADLFYRLDVTRDGGRIAKAALSDDQGTSK